MECYLSCENKINDDLGEHFINQKPPEFWKMWNAKIKRNISRVHLNGGNSDGAMLTRLRRTFLMFIVNPPLIRCLDIIMLFVYGTISLQ